jgi:chromosome segregation protein
VPVPVPEDDDEAKRPGRGRKRSQAGGRSPAPTAAGPDGSKSCYQGSIDGGNGNGAHAAANGAAGVRGAAAPNGSPPNGSTPNGSPPNGKVPNGTAADGSTPDGSSPVRNAAASNGSAANGGSPNSGSPNSGSPNGEAGGNGGAGPAATPAAAAQAAGQAAAGQAAAHAQAGAPVPAQADGQDRAAAPAEAGGPGQAAGPAAERAVRLIPYVRAEQEKRAATAQRQLDQLGKVNPLALEEFEALEERHAFLASQLEDLKKTRRDLLLVVKEVDDRVQQVFASAYADTAAEFSQIFERLFPGGEGRLVLTEPDDMLATGIDVEARPPGKKVKRLSLLSGGERSLTAIAYLVAIFKARPSPFYVLDEVEAALDDTNLQRLLTIFEELRDSSQLIIVTHQRRTMEAADALYGISMRGDGVSAVISQRLREHERA